MIDEHTIESLEQILEGVRNGAIQGILVAAISDTPTNIMWHLVELSGTATPVQGMALLGIAEATLTDHKITMMGISVKG
jgi:hypothetical protein